MSIVLTYVINNGEPREISTALKSKTIADFFNIELNLQNDVIFMMDDEIIDKHTKINDFIRSYTDPIIKIYTPQIFRYEKREMSILFHENLKISELKLKLKHEFNILMSNIDIIVENDEQLSNFLNDDRHSFYKYIKPNIIFIIKTDKNDKKTINKKISNLSSLKLPEKNKKQNKTMYKAEYRINNGKINKISFTKDQGNTVYEIFSNYLEPFNEKDLIFTLDDNKNQYILLESQKPIESVFPTDFTISIFTPITFSYNKTSFQLPFQFNNTIQELKNEIKAKLNIRRDKNILFHVRDNEDLNSIFNNNKKHLIKLVQPDIIIDIILDEFRFTLVDEVFESKDGQKESGAIVRLNTTASDFIE